MKKIIPFLVFFLISPAIFFSQTTNPLFLNNHILSAPDEVEPYFPQNLFSGNEVASYDTTLPARIIASMNATYGKQRLYARHGVACSIHIPGHPDWSGAIGLNDETNPMDTGLVFEVASNTKTFVTALIMKLQDQGKLSIKDSIGKWLLKKYPNVDGQITIEQLLNHSSGIYDYLNDDPKATVFVEFFTDPTKRWTPDSILFNHVGAPNFKAGTSYKYSNTNFVLAGLIAESAGGAPLGTQIHTNFIDPLKLTRTFFGGEDSIPLPFAHNWSYADTSNPEIDYYDVDKTGQLSGAWGAGNIVATTSDLLRWCTLLYTGQVVSKAALAEMMAVHRWPDGSYYGLGTSRAPYGNKFLFGHGGSLLGFKSTMLANPKDSITVVVYMNSDPEFVNGKVIDATTNDYILDVFNEIYRAPASVSEEKPAMVIALSAFPNPATDHVTFYFRTGKESMNKLTIYNELGEPVKTLLNESLAPGIHSASCILTDMHAGTYFYRLLSGTEVATGKIVIK
jgi:D-alanyl-D-alanine carboxypeptidase